MTSCPRPLISEAGETTAHSRAEQAHALCLRLLAARARTRAELADRLTRRGYPDELSAAVLDRLAAVGLIDDEQFTEQWVRSRQQHAGKGKRALAAELRTKGVSEEVIASALDGIDAGAERVRAEELVARRLRRESLAEGDETKVMRRLVGMLARRGYNQSMAVAVVNDALAAERQRRRV